MTFGLSEMLGSTSKLFNLKLDENSTASFSIDTEQSTFGRYPKRSRPRCDEESKALTSLLYVLFYGVPELIKVSKLQLAGRYLFFHP